MEWVTFLTVSLRGGGSGSLVEATFSEVMVDGMPELKALDSLGGI